jgi:hypothetical protein
MDASSMSNDGRIKPFELAIVARGTARLSIAELTAMRKQPPDCFSPKLSPLFLKHSDEQTLAALAALYRAKSDFALGGEDFGPWAVLSISRYLGRNSFAALRAKYAAEGAWGISVQVIPHRTAHSVSGTISLALGLHGPAIGVNGGANGEDTGLLALPSILAQPQWNGAWLVFSKWEPELAVNESGDIISNSVCVAAALAVVNAENADQRTSLGYIRFEPNGSLNGRTAMQPAAGPHVGLLEHIFEDAEQHAASPRFWRRTPGKMQIEVGLTAPVGAAT